MNRQLFFQWMDRPLSLNQDTLVDLQQVIRDYPYFQSARVLFAMNLRLLDDYRYEGELRRCAAYIADRSRLRNLLMQIEEQKATGEPQVTSFSGNDRPAEEEKKLKQLEEQIKANLLQIEQNQLRLRELLAEKKSLTGEEEVIGTSLTGTKHESAFRPLPKDELLEEYIRQQSGHRNDKPAFFSPEEAAKKSLEENDGILSETLARLVAAQGKKDKAIKIYQQLMLKNPQKSSYFAAQIEKLINQP